MRTTPDQALALQADLVERLGIPRVAKYMWKGFVGFDENIHEDGPQLAEALRANAREAEVIRVSNDFSTLIAFAASQLDDSDTWDSSLAPTPIGLARFDNPLVMTDPVGREVRVHWILWGPYEGDQLIYMFNDHLDPDDIAKSYLYDPEYSIAVGELGRWGSVDALIMSDGGVVGGSEIGVSAQTAAELLAQGRSASPSTNPRRYIHAFWLMLAQPSADVEIEHVRKTTVRQMTGKGMDSKVSVVRLHQANAGRTTGQSAVEWTRRWLVHGHWRWVPYGPGRQQVRRRWIFPFVKGPADKPLIVSKKVYDADV